MCMQNSLLASLFVFSLKLCYIFPSQDYYTIPIFQILSYLEKKLKNLFKKNYPHKKHKCQQICQHLHETF